MSASMIGLQELALVSRVSAAQFRLARAIASVDCSAARRTSIRSFAPAPSSVTLQRRRERGYATNVEVKEPATTTVLDVLEERGLVNQLAGDRLRLQKLCRAREAGAYCGVDATAKSLHVGHMVPFMALFWMCLYGHTSVSLIGGATCRIGDPTGRLTSRTTLDSDDATDNIKGIEIQLRRLWNNVRILASRHGIQTTDMQERTLNNEAWAEVGFLTILRKLGTGFRLGAMLAKDTVRNKMEKGDGMSYAEFSYPLMQAWDWWHLYLSEDKVRVQIGGSDQYGNITAGMDAVNHMRQAEGNMAPDEDVFGFTVPLLTTSSGEKFGKSAGNALWLDRELLDPFKLYQFFVSTPDTDVAKLLKFFTFIPASTIDEIIAKHNADPSQRLAQHTLAFEFVALAHSLEEAQAIQERQKSLFGKGSTVEETIAGAPPVSMNADEVWNQPLTRVLHRAGLAPSAGAAGRTILNGGIYLGSARDNAVEWAQVAPTKSSLQRVLTKDDVCYPATGDETDVVLIRMGKTNMRAVTVIDV